MSQPIVSTRSYFLKNQKITRSISIIRRDCWNGPLLVYFLLVEQAARTIIAWTYFWQLVKFTISPATKGKNLHLTTSIFPHFSRLQYLKNPPFSPPVSTHHPTAPHNLLTLQHPSTSHNLLAGANLLSTQDIWLCWLQRLHVESNLCWNTKALYNGWELFTSNRFHLNSSLRIQPIERGKMSEPSAIVAAEEGVHQVPMSGEVREGLIDMWLRTTIVFFACSIFYSKQRFPKLSHISLFWCRMP